MYQNLLKNRLFLKLLMNRSKRLNHLYLKYQTFLKNRQNPKTQNLLKTQTHHLNQMYLKNHHYLKNH